MAPIQDDAISVIKRSGELADFDPARISESIRKAIIATGGTQSDESLTSRIVEDITTEVRSRFSDDFIPNVENIQDIVEKNLMKAQLFDVAKAYILFRADRQKLRDEQRKKKSFLKKLTVKKRDDKVVLFNYKKIESSVRRACADYSDVHVEMIIEEAIKNIYDGVTSDEIDKALVLASSSLIERDPNYSKVAARLFLQKLRKEVFQCSVDSDKIEDHYGPSFIHAINHGVAEGLLDPRMKDRFDLEKLANALNTSRDSLFEFQGVQTLYERYLLKDKNNRLEMPQAFWMRVAMGLAIAEQFPTEWAIKFYNVLSTFRFVSSTPTLFHAGTKCPQLSSCYLTYVSDDLSHIFKCLGDNAQLSKWSGGLGNDWTSVRGTGSWISSTKVESQGVIPFLKIANDVTAAINRSGKRRGATCAYLETWHFDIEDFLDLRKNTGDERRRTHDMNTANWIPDLFMKRVQEDKDWTLFSPDEVPDLHDLYGAAFDKRYCEYEKKAKKGQIKKFKIVSATKLWRKMLTMLFETGHPWMTWKDPSNIRSPQDHCGVVHSSNLCTEICLNTSVDETAVCNIGSINAFVHVTEKSKLNKEMLAETVETAMRMLDNVIDENFYPTIEAKNSNLKHRPVGLGLMGLQDALFMKRIPFDSKDAIDFGDEIMEIIAYHAILGSSKLAKERGVYSTYVGSKWHRGIFPQDTIELLEKERGIPTGIKKNERLNWKIVRDHVAQHGMRNSNTMAIAPTATIASIAGCFPCIEPIYTNIYVKANITGEFTIVNKYLVNDLKKRKLWNQDMLEKIKYFDGKLAGIDNVPADLKELYKEAFEIEPEWIIKHAGERGKWIDQSQSLNLWIKGASGKKLHDIYMFAWEKGGLKTCYYLRSLGASQVEKSTLDASKYGFTQLRNDEPAPVKACRINDPTCESCQ